MFSPKKKYISLFICHLFFFVSFSNEGKCIREIKRKFSVQYATHFKVKYLQNGCKLVIDGAGRKLLLIHSTDKVTIKNVLIDEIIKIPVRRVITRWSTIPSFLRSLEVGDTIVGVVTRKEEPCSEYLKSRLTSRNIEIVGGPGSLDYEKLVVLSPDIFFVSKWQSKKISKKLNQLNIPYAVISEYLEDNPLGRAEWIKFFASFYDKEEVAGNFFSGVVKRVKEISSRFKNKKLKPKVLWCIVRQDKTIYAPLGDSYVARMISMAGGEYVVKELKKINNAPISWERFYLWGKEADIFISAVPLPQYGISSIKKLVALHPMLRDFKSIKKQNVWYLHSLYWESADKIDGIIEDLAAVFYPVLFPNHKFKYFFKLSDIQ